MEPWSRRGKVAKPDEPSQTGTGTQTGDERARKRAEEADREVERISRTVVPQGDAPSRAGITGPGSGADSQKS